MANLDHETEVANALKFGIQPGDAMLSIRQPYALLIVEQFKPVENRSWPTEYRGILWIHASKTKVPPDWKKEVLDPCGVPKHEADAFDFAYGAIIGAAYLDGCYRFDQLPRPLTGNVHCVGEYCWHFTAAGRLNKPIPYKGAVGLLRFTEKNLL